MGCSTQAAQCRKSGHKKWCASPFSKPVPTPRTHVLMRIATFFKTLPLVTAAACAGRFDQPSQEVANVFENPSRYVGEQVEVCGYVRTGFEESNIWLDRRSMREGYGAALGYIVGSTVHSTSDTSTEYGCFVGEVVRTGCAVERICHWSSFEYAVRRID